MFVCLAAFFQVSHFTFLFPLPSKPNQAATHYLLRRREGYSNFKKEEREEGRKEGNTQMETGRVHETEKEKKKKGSPNRSVSDNRQLRNLRAFHA